MHKEVNLPAQEWMDLVNKHLETILGDKTQRDANRQRLNHHWVPKWRLSKLDQYPTSISEADFYSMCVFLGIVTCGRYGNLNNEGRSKSSVTVYLNISKMPKCYIEHLKNTYERPEDASFNNRGRLCHPSKASIISPLSRKMGVSSSWWRKPDPALARKYLVNFGKKSGFDAERIVHQSFDRVLNGQEVDFPRSSADAKQGISAPVFGQGISVGEIETKLKQYREGYNIQHNRRYRSSALVADYWQDFLKRLPDGPDRIVCPVCKTAYPLPFWPLFEVDHLNEIANGERVSTIDDLGHKCSLCHNWIHRMAPQEMSHAEAEQRAAEKSQEVSRWRISDGLPDCCKD